MFEKIMALAVVSRLGSGIESRWTTRYHFELQTHEWLTVLNAFSPRNKLNLRRRAK